MNEAGSTARTISIIGTGLVGSSWAVVFARAGLSVQAFDAARPGNAREPLS